MGGWAIGEIIFDDGNGDEYEKIRYMQGMAPKDLEELIERVRHWPSERQADAAEVLLEMERQDSSRYRLSDAQAEEVARIQREVYEGEGKFATDEQMAALWKSCGL